MVAIKFAMKILEKRDLFFSKVADEAPKSLLKYMGWFEDSNYKFTKAFRFKFHWNFEILW